MRVIPKMLPIFPAFRGKPQKHGLVLSPSECSWTCRELSDWENFPECKDYCGNVKSLGKNLFAESARDSSRAIFEAPLNPLSAIKKAEPPEFRRLGSL